MENVPGYVYVGTCACENVCLCVCVCREFMMAAACCYDNKYVTQ